MKISKFTHIFPIVDAYAYYNSLFLKPVFLTKEEHSCVESFFSGVSSNLDKDIEIEFRENKIIIDNDFDDDELINNAKKQLLIPYPTVAYFILSEKCNLACKYCFLGNSDIDITEKQMPKMTKDEADKGLKYFFKQLERNMDWYNHDKEIIFYGGEPLMNFEVLRHIINECERLQKIKKAPPKINFSMVTNGILLNSDIIDYLKEKNIAVSISIDGITEKANKNRVTKSGDAIFYKLIDILETIKEKEWKVGLSITLTEDTITSVDEIIALLQKYQIKSISFNLLHSAKDFQIKEGYYERASQFIIDFYKVARKYGIYEDRIMRKIDAFVEGKLYLSDCAATSGSQVVILPNGEVGICHGCLENKDYFFTNTKDETSLENNSTMLEWSNISPINNEKCISCEALGICGGGCPINAKNCTDGGSIHSIDSGFCVHAKKTLSFMIEDLYHILKTGRPL